MGIFHHAPMRARAVEVRQPQGVAELVKHRYTNVTPKFGRPDSNRIEVIGLDVGPMEPAVVR